MKIAYIGDYGFKELCTESSLLLGEHKCKDSKDFSDLEDDLQDTGLFGPDSDSGEVACDTDNAQNQEQMDCNNNNDDNTQTQEQMDVKPPLMLAQCSFTATVDNPIVFLDEEEIDVKPPLMHLQCLFTTSADNPIVLSDEEQVDVKPLIH